MSCGSADERCLPEGLAEVLLDRGTIDARVRELAAQIDADYADQDLILMASLKGAVVFLSDLMRAMSLPVRIEFVQASSYGLNGDTTGNVRLGLATCEDLAGHHVLLVEDIADTGRTLKALVARLRELGTASVRTCCLLDKPSRRVVEFVPDYVGFEIPDRFVVGYGLDWCERFRSLPYVAVVRT
jgi:hypoxanthine phosphoribosyltransferase